MDESDKTLVLQNVLEYGPSQFGMRASAVSMAAGVLAPLTALLLGAARPALAGLTVGSFYAVMLGLAGLLVTLFGTRKPRGQPTELRVDPSQVVLGGRVIARRADITSGAVYQHEATTFVRLVRRGGRLSVGFSVDNLDEGRRVLETLKLDAGHVSAQFWATAPSSKHFYTRWKLAMIGPVLWIASTVGAGVLFGSSHGAGPKAAGVFFAAAMVVGMSAMLALIGQMAVPTRVVVGSDGILTRWLWQQRFISWRDISNVEVEDGPMVLKMQPRLIRLYRKDGGPPYEILVWMARISMWGKSRYYENFNASLEKRRAMIVERIREAIDAQGAPASQARALSLPTRTSGPITQWVDELRGLLNASGYRDGAPPNPDQLWRVVEDPRSDEATRAAAAVALSPALNDQGKHRLRVAAQATAAPRLRVALESVATQDEGRLAEVLEELTHTPRKQA